MKTRVLALLLLLASPVLASAVGSGTPVPRGRAAVAADVRTVGRDLRAVPHQLAAHEDQAAYVLALGGSAALLEEPKARLRRQVLESETFANSSWTDIGGKLGLSRNVEIAAATCYFGGLASGQSRLRETGLLLGESLFAAQLDAGLINYTISERRPQDGGKILHFSTGGHAASIHETNTMALARVLDHELAAAGDGPLERVLRVAVYSIPAVTGWERLRADQHYLWNVVLGGGASLYVTNAVLHAHEGGATTTTPPRTELLFAPAPRGAGGGLFLVRRLGW